MIALWWALLTGCGVADEPPPPPVAERRIKLYWFVPDGLRADRDAFDVFRWAEAGELPNLKALMDRGARGYSIPDFPSHTPVNFATLLTGSHPDTHGVSDGPMHAEGSPLSKPAVGGFNANAKRVPAVWSLLEATGRSVFLLSVPGSTPPQLERGVTVRGRWSQWGADTPGIVFESASRRPGHPAAGNGARLFFQGQALTRFVAPEPAGDWCPPGDVPPIGWTLTAHGASIPACVHGAPDEQAGYDRVSLRLDDGVLTAEAGERSDWRPVTLTYGEQPFASSLRLEPIRIWPDGAFRVLASFDQLNELVVAPPEVALALREGVGPMTDFPDNWPAQLNVEPEDADVVFGQMAHALDWHRRAAGFVLDRYDPDVFVQDTYTPNQVLESRWWLPRTVEDRPGYDEAAATEAWATIHTMYGGVDQVLGEILARADEDTIVVFSSDHGVLPIDRQVRLNNLFAEKGWLVTTRDAEGNEIVDWSRSKVAYLKMAYVYVHPDGLGGDWHRASGPAYEALRDEVIAAISELRDDRGLAPLVRAATWEDATERWDLPRDRIGDLVLEAKAGFQWWEEVSEDRAVFAAKDGGYKQAVDPRVNEGLWTPFVIAGPGVKPGVVLRDPIDHVDQLATILALMGVERPAHLEGRVLEEIRVPLP